MEDEISAGAPGKSEPQQNDAGDKIEDITRASIQDFRKLSLRVGTIISAEDHPNADRLLVLKVDIGEDSPRQVVAGIKQSYQTADLIDKQVIIVVNLKTAVLRGIESQGMILAASDEASMVLLSPEHPMPAGCIVR